MPEEEPSSLSVLEERIAAEEEVISERVRALERQVQSLHEHKVAVQQARVLAESHQHAEAELKRWEASLFAEVESATCRLNEQRQAAGSSNPAWPSPSPQPRPTLDLAPALTLILHTPTGAARYRCTAFDVSLAQKIQAVLFAGTAGTARRRYSSLVPSRVVLHAGAQPRIRRAAAPAEQAAMSSLMARKAAGEKKKAVEAAAAAR